MASKATVWGLALYLTMQATHLKLLFVPFQQRMVSVLHCLAVLSILHRVLLPQPGECCRNIYYKFSYQKMHDISTVNTFRFEFKYENEYKYEFQISVHPVPQTLTLFCISPVDKKTLETNLSPIHTNKTCLIKPGLTKWKLITES